MEIQFELESEQRIYLSETQAQSDNIINEEQPIEEQSTINSNDKYIECMQNTINYQNCKIDLIRSSETIRSNDQNKQSEITKPYDSITSYYSMNSMRSYDLSNNSIDQQYYSPIQQSQDKYPSQSGRLCSLKERQFDNILNKYQNQLQIKVKRVKQKIKKGQFLRQKKLFCQPISSLYVYNIQLNNKFMIYGCLLIEDNYRDYDSQFSPNLINQFDQYLRLEQIEKDNINQLLTFSTSSTMNNLMRRFKMICSYYEQSSNQDYKNLSDLLRKYEVFIEEYDEQWKQLYEKYTKEEIENYKTIYFSEAKQFLTSHSTDQFMSYCMFDYNSKEKLLEPIKNGNTYSLSNLIGIRIEYIENLIKKVNSFMSPIGMKRMEQVMVILELITSNKDYIFGLDQSIMTIDGININSKIDIQFFKTENIPKDLLNVMKQQCIIQTYDISIFDIQKIILQRGEELDKIYSSIEDEPVHIENTIMTELFIEKFYPNQFQKIRSIYDQSKS